jgi:cytoskeletal protein RodZ
MALSKIHGLGFLFIMLIVVLIVSPRSLNNLYNNTLGRVALIALIIFFAMNNVTLGLLAALCVIIASNMYMFEGMENMTEDEKNKLKDKVTTITTTIPTSTTTPSTTTPSTTTSTTTTPSTTTPTTTGTGVDKEAIKDAIQAKASNAIQVAKSDFASTEVEPTTAPSTTTQEGFSLIGAPY